MTSQQHPDENKKIMLAARGLVKIYLTFLCVNPTKTHFLSMQSDVVAWRDLRIDAIFPVNRSGEQAQVVLSIVAFAWRKECAIEIVAIVKHRSTAAVASRKLNTGRFQLTHVRLVEWILMTTDDDARIVDPKHENVMIAKVIVLVDPVFECEIGEDVI